MNGNRLNNYKEVSTNVESTLTSTIAKQGELTVTARWGILELNQDT